MFAVPLFAMSSLATLSASLFGVALLTYSGVAWYRRLAIRWNILDHPTGRSSHRKPVPVGGGIVILILNLAGWGLWGLSSPGHATIAVLLLVAALMLAVVSLVDDLGHVHYRIRLMVHVGVATLLVVGVGYWHAVELPIFGRVSLGVLGLVLTVFWIAGVVNAFNFVDGLDGMAASQAAIAGAGWLGLGLVTHNSMLVVFGVLLVASCTGFLLHNWQPATIFMGDVGSTFLGFSLAALPIVAVRDDPRFAIVAVLLIWPAIFDCTFTLLVRIAHGENVFGGHRSFLFHRLVDCGWSHAAAASLYATFPAIGAALAFSWQWKDRIVHLVIVLTLGSLCLALWALVRYQERRQQTIRAAGGVLSANSRQMV